MMQLNNRNHPRRAGAIAGALCVLVDTGIGISAVLTMAVLIFATPVNARADNENSMGMNAPEILEISDSVLLLNGEGRRIKHFLVLYGCALYVQDRPSTYEEIVKLDKPIAFRVEVTFDLLPDDMPSSWVAELHDSVTDDEFQILLNAYQDLGAGDVAVILYEPGRGTSVIVNGVPQLLVRNGFLMRSFVELWLSNTPVSQELRAALLSEDDPDL